MCAFEAQFRKASKLLRLIGFEWFELPKSRDLCKQGFGKSQLLQNVSKVQRFAGERSLGTHE